MVVGFEYSIWAIRCVIFSRKSISKSKYAKDHLPQAPPQLTLRANYYFIAGGAEDGSPEKGIGYPKVQLLSCGEDIFYYGWDKIFYG